jgi:hypothetical protein
MAFDFQAAEAAGYSKQDILKEMEKSGNVSFDFAGARKAGYSTDKIYEGIKTKLSQPKQDLPEIPDELPEVVAGPPEEYDNGLVGETSVGEITVLPETNTIPENQQLDLQTTAPSQPMVGEKGQLTTTTDLPMSIGEEATRRASGPEGMKAMQASGLQQPPEGMAYRDPKTGEVVSTATQASSIEPAYDILFGPGGKLGAFGILSGPAGVEAGKVVGKKAAEVAQAIDDIFKTHPAAGLGDALSKEAKYILNRNPNITEEQVVQALQGVKTTDQAYALSRMLGETGYIRQAVRADGDVAAGALRADLEVARDKILQTVGTVDVAQAKAKYADMVQAIAGDYQNVHNATPILEDLNFLERFYGVTPSTGNRVVTQMKATLVENPNINLSDALEFRADLNHLISKATRGKEKVKLNSIKENLDGFINSVATLEQKSMIDDAIGTYSRTMQNRDVLDLVERNTKDGIAVNWTKLHRDLNDANLRSPEAVDALRIAEAFSKRFGNDKKLLNIAMPQGSSPDSGGVLGAWGYVINHLKDTLAVYGNRAENLKIQKAILKSIKSGTTNLDFVNKLKANGDVPDEVSKIFENLLQIPYKAGARQTGDVNLEPIITPVGGTEAKAVPKVVEEAIPKPSNVLEAPPAEMPRPAILEDELLTLIRRRRELAGETGFEGLSSAELLAKRNEMLNTPERNRNNAWWQEWEEVNQAYARAPAASNEMPSTKPPEVDTTIERPYSRLEDKRGPRTYEDPGDIKQFKQFDDLPDSKRTEELRSAITQLEAGNTITINGKTFDKFHLYLDEDGEATISLPLIEAISRNTNSNNKIFSRLPRYLQDKYSSLQDKIDNLDTGKEDYGNTYTNLVEAKNKILNKSEGAVMDTSATLAQAEESFNTLRRDISRLERVRVADRTPQQTEQLAEMRRDRLIASREVERLSNTIPKAEQFFNSFRNSNHTIEVVDRGNGSFTLSFNGNRVPMTIRNNNTVSLNTQGFTEGTGQGTKFYEEFYTALDAAGLKHNISGLTLINTMRLPINIYRHWLKTGNLPIAGGPQKLQNLMRDAIRKISEVAGTDIRHLTDSQIPSLATRTGPMRGVHAGEASLKLYRKAARLLGENRNLSVIALAPLINAAYEEGEENE